MKIVKIEPVPKPSNFKDLGFSAEDYKAAAAGGVLELPYATAMENIRLSKGLYQVVPDVQEVEVKIAGLKDPEDMSKTELVMEMTSWGKPPKKQMTLSKCREFVAQLRESAVDLIVDDE